MLPVPDTSTTVLVSDLVGILVFALSGGLAGVRRGNDIFGIIVLAGITGLGGGTIRDVLIGAVPPASLQDWRYILVPLVGGLIVFFFHGAVGRAEGPIVVLDAVGTGVFVAAGALKALDFGLGPLPATLMGLVTGIGGGILRDALTGRVPMVFTKGQLYAIPAAAGAAFTAFGAELGLAHLLAGAIGAAICIVWRLLAVWRNWTAPLPQITDHAE